MHYRYLFLFSLTIAFTDIIAINIAFYTALFLCDPLTSQLYYTDFALILNLTWIISIKTTELYSKRTIHKELLMVNTLKCVGLHAILFLVYVNGAKGPFMTGSFFTLFYALLGLMFLLNRICSSNLSPHVKRRFKMTSPMAIIGKNPTSLQLAAFFKQNSKLYSFAGFLNPKESLKQAAAKGIREVYVSLAPDKINEISGLVEEANTECIQLKFLPDFSQIFPEPLNIRHLQDLLIIRLTGAEYQEEMQSRFLKRLFDLAFSSVVILFVLSWLYPILAILIKLESKGPVIFKQDRSGRDNVNFWCYKFRSMKMNADSNTRQAGRTDDRITKIGKFMRKTSLDEFPQFLNVLLGNMSVVGPRPHMLKHTEQYRYTIDKYMVRHYLKPGITGWAQINGFRGETQQPGLMEKRVQHDIWYLNNLSPYLDLKIIFLTITQIFKGHKNAF